MEITSTVKEYHDILRRLEKGVIKAKRHHTTIATGYVARDKAYIEFYDGRFGSGYKVHKPSADNPLTQRKMLHTLEYWIVEEGENNEGNVGTKGK